jgi:flavin-dependent dehydrogenase
VIAKGAMPMERCLLAEAGGRSVESPLPDLPRVGRTAYGLSRAVLDELLLHHASDCGAAVRERAAASGPVLTRGRVTGITLRAANGSTAETIAASLVVAADGRRSIIQRVLHPPIGDPLTTSSSSWFGFKAHFPDRTAGLSGRIELFVFDGGYAGLGPIEGERLDLALIARVGALTTPQRLFEERVLRNPLLAARLDGRPPCSRWKSIGPLRFNVRKAASHGALFLGDAAGTIDPFSGEGISNALRGAELALPFVLEALARGGLDPQGERAWTRAWRQAFAPVTRRARLIGRIFEHRRPASLAVSLLHLPRGARILPSLVAATRTGAV